MSIVVDPEKPRVMKLVRVRAEVEMESPVHRCDRCGKEAPRGVSTDLVDTNREWQAGQVSLLSVPDGWTQVYTGGPIVNDNQLGARWLDTCQECTPVVLAAWEQFVTAATNQGDSR